MKMQKTQKNIPRTEKKNQRLIDDLQKRVVELEKQNQELRESEGLYRDLVERINDVIFALNLSREITYINPSVKYILGYIPEELRGQNFFDLVYPDDRNEILTALGDVLNNQLYPSEYRMLRKDGSICWVRSSSRPVYKDGKVAILHGVLTDISERKHAEMEIRNLSQHIMVIQEQERQKTAQNLHDGVGQTILAAKLNIEAYRNNPARDSERLDMALTFIENASQELREIYTNLYPSILHDIGLNATIQWLTKNHLIANGIHVTFDISLSEPLHHDIEVELYRIIQEIFSNILKHSGADSVNIILNNDREKIELTVEDNGIGFEKNDSACTGFGLSNIRQRILNKSGSCTIDSIPGEGTRVLIHIPGTDRD